MAVPGESLVRGPSNLHISQLIAFRLLNRESALDTAWILIHESNAVPSLSYDAPRLLKAFLKAKKPLTQAEAAEQLGIVPSALSGYLKGTQRPRDEVRERIARWSRGKVPVRAWRTADEAKAIADQDAAFIPKALADSQKTAKPAA